MPERQFLAFTPIPQKEQSHENKDPLKFQAAFARLIRIP